jgi:SAM-dependent methyltransferase
VKQNKYDDPEFFARYSAMERSTQGLSRAGEWPVLRAMIPEVLGKRVLDLGCGFGWHCRYLRDLGARSVVGVDLSARMLERAREMTSGTGITYVRGAIEDVDFPAGSFDVVLSSLALHYVAAVSPVFDAIHRLLAPGGELVFSTEHPIFTARAEQSWWQAPDGTKLHWPVDGYRDEGERRSSWLAPDVVKYHRTLSTLLNGLIAAGFDLRRVEEPGPPPDAVARDPSAREEERRPMFLLVAARKRA